MHRPFGILVMVTVSPSITVRSARPSIPMVPIHFRLLRDGQVTAGAKFLRLYQDWNSISSAAMAFEAEDGEFTKSELLNLAVLQSQGDWLVAGIDDQPPRKTRAAYLQLQASGMYLFNITSGEDAGGGSGNPGTVAGTVRVEGSMADRQVVLIERPADGEWRLAGFGPTPGGTGVIDVRVTGGEIYAVAIDDWGVAFTADLRVEEGQVVRPSYFTGWLYQVTQAGTLPVVEPVWWPAIGENPSRPLGTARAIAVRYFRPLAHGPVPVERI